MTEWLVPEGAAGERLDRHVAERLDIPRSRAQRWIRDGAVRVDGRTAKASLALRSGWGVACDPPPTPTDERVRPEDAPLSILHADDDLIVVDKPAGLTVHPGAGQPEGTLVHRLLHRYPELDGVGGPGRPGIVHRLDKLTSGVMVVARTDRAYRSLQQAFAAREPQKLYLAIAYGRSKADTARIDRPIGRHRSRRKEMTVRDDGRPAITDYRVVSRSEAVELWELTLLTGRTHQIRVHLKAIGHPLVGDPVYGENRWRAAPPHLRPPLRTFPRPALHAWRLAVPHPTDGRTVRFEAPPPADLRELWSALSGEELPLPDSASG